jgi:hypothetical protein
MMRTNGASTGDGMGRYPVTEAANILGISTEATRQRIKRGTLPTERDEEGNVFVLLKGNGTRTTADSTRTNANGTDDGTPGGTHTNANRTGDGTDDKERLIRFLSEQLDHEREVNRENRRIIAGLVQRVPELEATLELREAPVTVSEGSGDGMGREEEDGPQERRSWWRRFFGVE